MEKRVRKWLYDILLSIEEIESYLEMAKATMTLPKTWFCAGLMERSFEIIGEALNRIGNANPHIEISDMREYIGMRNIIAHGYDIVSYQTLWDAANKDVPKLKSEVEKLLNL